MNSACQNAVRAAQSAPPAHADHVAISCPENPHSVFIYLLWGVPRATRTELCRNSCEVFIAHLFVVRFVDSSNVSSCSCKLISDNFLWISVQF